MKNSRPRILLLRSSPESRRRINTTGFVQPWIGEARHGVVWPWIQEAFIGKRHLVHRLCENGIQVWLSSVCLECEVDRFLVEWTSVRNGGLKEYKIEGNPRGIINSISSYHIILHYSLPISTISTSSFIASQTNLPNIKFFTLFLNLIAVASAIDLYFYINTDYTRNFAIYINMNPNICSIGSDSLIAVYDISIGWYIELRGYIGGNYISLNPSLVE